ncbi:hypothetical protein L873DRAFT_927621 [Choiromyces venosus 120613-1]|uniref:Uncharacterized protein n=1 Tax=Choiromyces venosus 120613-1 TaxID=1336337 RepID=A0A3N4JLM6_9PEZI|nr:hypothetical protein L873DRAFT_927621 [Choiromyces venosus 120613-1]
MHLKSREQVSIQSVFSNKIKRQRVGKKGYRYLPCSRAEQNTLLFPSLLPVFFMQRKKREGISKQGPFGSDTPSRDPFFFPFFLFLFGWKFVFFFTFPPFVCLAFPSKQCHELFLFPSTFAFLFIPFYPYLNP